MIVALILACILAALAALAGIGIQALRHGHRFMLRWLLLPLGAVLTFAERTLLAWR